MTSTAAAQHHPAQRALLKAAASTLLLVAAAGGVWQGSHAAAAHFFQPAHVEVSYASSDYTVSMLHRVHHSAARHAGSFVTTASLSSANVYGVQVDTGE